MSKKRSAKRAAKRGAKWSSGPNGRQDYYFKKAKKENFAARAVYKLSQMDGKYKIFRPGQNVLDLGCRPGSWMQYACKKIGDNGFTTGVDILEMDLSLPNAKVICEDIYKLDPETLGQGANSFDVVMSDMAPNTTGIKSVDQLKSAALAEIAFDIAERFLKPGGHFIAKIFMGPDEPKLYKKIKDSYQKAARYKPDASRSESTEIYLLGIAKKAEEKGG